MVDHARKGSRSRAVAWDVKLTGTSSRRPNGGNRGADGDAYAATWDEWGMFLAELFRRDPDATIPGVYESEAHFRWSTGERFDDLAPAQQHRNHRWEHEGKAATGTYYVSTCKCGARQRRVAYGHTFYEIHGTLSQNDGY